MFADGVCTYKTTDRDNRTGIFNGLATTDVHSFVFYISLDLITVKKWKKQPVHGKCFIFTVVLSFLHENNKIKYLGSAPKIGNRVGRVTPTKQFLLRP